jgi:hypothetical protein
LAAKSAGEIGRLALLQKNNANEKQANSNVQDNEKNEHEEAFGPTTRQVSDWLRHSAGFYLYHSSLASVRGSFLLSASKPNRPAKRA